MWNHNLGKISMMLGANDILSRQAEVLHEKELCADVNQGDTISVSCKASTVDISKPLPSQSSVEALSEYEDIIKMTFPDDDEAYEFFNNYAKEKGFSVRKDKTKHHQGNGMLSYRRFLCSRAGLRRANFFDTPKRKRKERHVTRCNCPVQFCIKLDSSSGVWFVSNFVDVHNHALATEDEVLFLRSHRKMNEEQKSNIVSLELAGLRKHQIMDVMEHWHGGCDKVGFTKRDLYNFCASYKKSKNLEGEVEVAPKELQADGIPRCCTLEQFSMHKNGNMQSWTEHLARYCDLSDLGSQVFHEASMSREDYLELKNFLESKLKSKKDVQEHSIWKRQQNSELSPNMLDSLPVVSKGALNQRTKPISDGKYRCGHCHFPGHNRQSCPLLKQQEVSEDRVNFW